MSKPSFSNIDLWLFELSEGNLSAEQVAQLELFLLQHPEFDVDRDMWSMANVSSDPVVYPGTAALNKRKPAALYSAVGTTLFILLTFVGCYQYMDVSSIDRKVELASSGMASDRQDIHLLSEIDQLKLDVQNLESENRRLTEQLGLNTQQEVNNSLSIIENGNNAMNRPNNGRQNRQIASNSIGNNSFISNSNVRRGNTNQIMQNGHSEISSMTEYERIHRDKSGLKSNVRTYAPRVIDYDWYNGRGPNGSKAKLQANSNSSDDKKHSFKSKMKKISRSVQRMMDNPIALKNSRNPHYHVPGALSQDLNFGSNGTLLTTRVQTLSRVQWLGKENEQMMNQLAFDTYAYNLRGGIGIQLNHSMYKNGGVHVGDVAITYSPKFSVSKWISVEPALRFKMGNKMLDHKVLDGVSQIEMDRGNVFDYNSEDSPMGQSLWYKDLGLGLMVNTKWFFIGAQVDNMLHHYDNIYSKDNESPRRAGTHFVATVGTDWESRKENMSLSPYGVYQLKENLSEAWIGLNYRWGWFNIGGAISSNLEPAGSIGLKFEHFALNYNIDYTNSIMSNTQSLSHQVSLRFSGKTSRFGRKLLNL